MIEPALYLIPCQLSTEGDVMQVLSPQISVVMADLQHYAVEQERTARRFIRRVAPQIDADKVEMYNIGKHTPFEEFSSILQLITKEHLPVGVLSEAGCPGVADPGALLVRAAHDMGIRVVPLIGPSSILLSLMASGLNGQSFAFRGYLPKEKPTLRRTLQMLQRQALQHDETQIFIETPYRNDRLLSDLCASLSPEIRLCVAVDITGPNESIRTKTVAAWRKEPATIGKLPAIFLFGR